VTDSLDLRMAVEIQIVVDIAVHPLQALSGRMGSMRRAQPAETGSRLLAARIRCGAHVERDGSLDVLPVLTHVDVFPEGRKGRQERGSEGCFLP
jgi:hypothetical protein